MSRKLTPQSSLENLKREAKRWLHALRDGDSDALARFAGSHPTPPATPGLRDVQYALAREYGCDGWTALKAELARLHEAPATARDAAMRSLLEAAEQGDAARLIEVLDAHPGIVNERSELIGHTGKRTALHFAMNSMNEQAIDALLERGADPNIRDDGDNAFPLHFAAEKGELAVVRKLVEHGADPIGTGDAHELEVIGWAVSFSYVNHTDVADYLLAHGARHNISSAVAMGRVDAIREIAARSPADLDRPMDSTNHHRRPLHLAILKKQPDSLDALLDLGADPEATDAAGLTPLDQAAILGERDIVARLMARGARMRLPAAVALERLDDVTRLLEEEPDALRPGGRWEALIIRAAERAPGEVIEALLRAGASVHARDNHLTAVDGTHGYTPLHAAAFSGNESAVRSLLRHGAKVADRETKYSGTPAGWAAYAGHLAIRDLILDSGNPIDIFDAISFRPERIAEIVARDPEALTRRFGEYLSGDDNSEAELTPMAYAVARGKVEAARILEDLAAQVRASGRGS